MAVFLLFFTCLKQTNANQEASQILLTDDACRRILSGIGLFLDTPLLETHNSFPRESDTPPAAQQKLMNQLSAQNAAPKVGLDGRVDPKNIETIFQNSGIRLSENLSSNNIAIGHFKSNPSQMFYIVWDRGESPNRAHRPLGHSATNFYIVGDNPSFVHRLPHGESGPLSREYQELYDFFGPLENVDSVRASMRHYHAVAINTKHKLHPMFKTLGPDSFEQLMRLIYERKYDSSTVRTRGKQELPLDSLADSFTWGEIEGTPGEFLFIDHKSRSSLQVGPKSRSEAAQPNSASFPHYFFERLKREGHNKVRLLKPDGTIDEIMIKNGYPVVPSAESSRK